MDGHDFENIDLSQIFEPAANGQLSLDLERYQRMLDGSGLSEAQKKDVLEALWRIVVTVVQLGYGVHPVQEVCGKPGQLSEEWHASRVDALECEDKSQKEDRKDAPEAE